MSTNALAADPPAAHDLADRWFYSAASATLLVLMLLGFHRYYLRGRAYPDREIAPPAKVLVFAHASATTAWVVLAAVQPLLVAGGRYRAHMVLGYVGAAIAVIVACLGLLVAVVSSKNTPPEVIIWGLPPKPFMAISVVGVVSFAAFVAAGVAWRSRPEVHRPMMLTATLVIIPAAVARIGPVSGLYADTALVPVFGPYLGTLVLATAFLAVKCFLSRSFDRWLAAAYVGLVANLLLTVWFARTAAWDRVGTYLYSLV